MDLPSLRRVRRFAHGKTLDDAIRVVKVTAPYLSLVEQGEVHSPRLAAALDRWLDQLDKRYPERRVALGVK